MNTLLTVVWTLTAALQLTGIFAAIHLARVTRQRFAWGAMAAAIALASRRTVTTFSLLTDPGSQITNLLSSQTVSCVVSALLVGALLSILPVYRRSAFAAVQLRESERTLSTLMSNLPGMAYRCRNDREWTMEFVSEGCADLTGYQPNDLLNNKRLTYAHLIHADDRAAVWNDVQRAIDTRSAFRLVYRIQTANGQERWVWEQGRGVFSDDGKDLLWLEGFVTDVTDRKKSELRLRESEQQFRQVAESLEQVFYMACPRRERFVYLSPAFAAIWGQPNETLRDNPKAWLEAIHPDDRAAVEESLSRQLGTGGYSLEYRVLRPDGGERWVLDRAFELKHSDGAPYRIIGVVDDVTERKRADLALKESEEKFRLALDNIHEVVWLTDWITRKVEYVSKAYETVWGRSCQSLYDDPKSWRTVIHPEDHDYVTRSFDASDASAPFDVEYRIVRDDGRIRWIHDRAFPVLDSAGRIIRMAGFSEDVTERKESELALQAQREEYATVFNSVPAMIWYKDRHNRILRANQPAARSIGRTVEEVEGASTYDLFPNEAARYHRDDLDVIESGKPKLGILEPYRVADGEERWLRTDKIPYRDGRGGIQGVIVFAQDITDQKRAEEARRESVERFRSAFENAPIGMCLVSMEGRYLQVNHQLCRMWGYTEEELLNRDFQSVTHPDDMAESLEVLGKLRAGTGDRFHLQKRYRHRDGRVVWGDVSVSLIRDSRNRPSYFVSHVHDITESRLSAERLRESEARFRSAFDAAPIGMALIGPKNEMQRVNRRLCEMLGYQEAELLGTAFDAIAHQEDVALCRRMYQQFLSGEVSFIQLEKRYLHKDGSIVWTEVTGSVVRDDGGTPIHFVVHINDITKRLEDEAARRQSEEFFRGAFDHAPIGMTVNTADGKIMQANAKLCAMLGYSEDELTRLSFQEITHPDDLPKDLTAYNEFVHGSRELFLFEKRYMHKRGHPVWIELSVSAVRDAAGTLLYFVAQMQDITQRREAEQALRESEERYRTLTEAAQDSIFMINREDRVDFVNGFAARQFGVRPEQLLGRRRDELFPGEVGERQLRNLRTVFDTGQIVDAEGVARFPSGERFLHTRLAPLHDGNGRVKAVLGISRDITDRRRDEQALRRSDERSRQMIDTVPCGIAQIDLSGQIRHANAEALRIAGLTYEQATSMTIYDFAPATLWEDGTPCPPEEYPAVKTLRTCRASLPATIGLRRTDGEISWCIFHSVPAQDPRTDEMTGAFIAFVDITARKHAEGLRAQRDAADAANRAKSQFLGNVSHEIRTPITALLGAAELIRVEHTVTRESRDCVDMIIRNGRHLLALVNDLLDTSKIESGTLDFHPTECSFAELMADLQAVTSPLHMHPGVEFTFTYETPVPRLIRTDPTRFKQAAINLIGNALKFTDEGRVTVRITFLRLDDQRQLQFCVEDTGMGVRAGDIDAIFRAFTRVDHRPGRVAAGAGLGLPLTRWIAEHLGGTLAVTSEEGRGSQFTLTLPAGPDESGSWFTMENVSIPLHGTSDPLRPAAAPAPVGRVLVAEDAPDVRSLLVYALRRAGADVVAVENGKEAVRAAAQEAFDLIILDIRMPVMDGTAAVAEIRRQGWRTPIIAMTASVTHQDTSTLLDAGFDEVWPKPMGLDQMVEAASAYLPGVDADGARSPIVSVTADRKAVVRPRRVSYELARLEFVASLSKRFNAIVAAQRAGDAHQLRDVLHQLIGTAGIHECMDISREAARLSKLAKASGTNITDVDLTELESLITRAMDEKNDLKDPGTRDV